MSLVYNLGEQWMLDLFGNAVIIQKKAFMETWLAAVFLAFILFYGYALHKMFEYREKQVAELRRAVMRSRPSSYS